MKSRCVILRGDGGLVHSEGDRGPRAASLAGREGPKAGSFCPPWPCRSGCPFLLPGMLSSHSSLF